MSTVVIVAKRRGRCAACGEAVEPGDRIARVEGEAGPWVHAVDCCGEYYGEEATWSE